MASSPAMIMSAAALAASISTAYAGPCSLEIDKMQARIETKLESNAAAGLGARESTNALLHRQPTPGSIAAAEERLGELSDQKVAAVAQAMERARAADGRGDNRACEQALADAQRAIGP